jgi:8-oxo-dGTP pyrophosphatase MutT (NUDIX family)
VSPSPPNRPRPSGRRQRPRDAATLVLVRAGAEGPEVLLGQRHADHVFMPSRYVFPGGRVDRLDHRAPAATRLRADVQARLERAASPARAHALAAAAIRETFEETGLMLAEPWPEAAPARLAAPWDAFAAAGLGPALGALDYVFRAVTPPGRPRRFNARFFLADAGAARGTLRGNGELEDLRWVALDAAIALPLPGVTRLVLAEVARLIAEPPPPEPDRPVPRVRSVRGRMVVDRE